LHFNIFVVFIMSRLEATGHSILQSVRQEVVSVQ